jgi:hypothetical protein
MPFSIAATRAGTSSVSSVFPRCVSR